MKTILAATDFSVAAPNAVNYAAEMARTIHADILLLHVYQMLAGYPEVPVAVGREDIRRGAEQQLNDLMEQLIKKTATKLEPYKTIGITWLCSGNGPS